MSRQQTRRRTENNFTDVLRSPVTVPSRTHHAAGYTYRYVTRRIKAFLNPLGAAMIAGLLRLGACVFSGRFLRALGNADHRAGTKPDHQHKEELSHYSLPTHQMALSTRRGQAMMTK